MKKILSFLLCVAMTISFAACSSDNSTNSGEVTTAPSESTQSTTAKEEETVAVSGKSPLTDDEAYDAMVERSLMTLGDTSRMLNVLKKAQNGEEITIGYIGGSITEGLTAGAELCWAKLTYDWLCEKFPETKINYVNAGLSGTPSTLGVMRAERDLYAEFTPDIVFIEFAVNDGQTANDKTSYESLVKKILSKENNPAVVLFFTVIESGYTCEKHMSEIGTHYNLPMISLNNSLEPEFDAGTMKWSDYSDDQSHPNIWGHSMVKDLVANYFEKVLEKLGETDEIPQAMPIPEAALISTKFEDMHFLDANNLTADVLGSFKVVDNAHGHFKDGWQNKAAGTDAIEFTVECKTMFLVYLCSSSRHYGTAEIYVDGELVKEVNASDENGWNNPENTMLFSYDETATHKITIKLKEEKTIFAILGFGVC